MELKKLLKKTWAPFFGRHARLFKIQEMAIPHILGGRNAIVVSPAATGKTEAAVAPVLERLLVEEIGPLSLLYISPTRALVNDLELRLRSPLEALGVTLAVRTGDRPRLSKSKPENVLITTPESLDSLLCRLPRHFSAVRAIILDELHLLDNTCRGDQLICLLNRIRRFHTDKPIQQIALSATISDPASTGERYFEDVTVIDAGERREICWYMVDDPESAVRCMKKERLLKAILFCNSRKDVERLAVEIGEVWPKDRLLVHHGSLSRSEREETESTFRLWDWGICVSTMTLEIGVDIGDIDASVLFKPPPSPSSFLQRVGRSCRRRDKMVAICIAPGPEDRAIFEEYAEMASEGKVEGSAYSPDLSVVVQQIFSILFGNPGGVDINDLAEVISPLSAPETTEKILAHLIDKGFVEPGMRGKLRATTKLMDMGERGTIHSNISDLKEYRVVDINSGKNVGSLVIRAARGSTFLLSGKAWEIVEERRDRLGVKMVKSLGARTHFTRRHQTGAFASLLPRDMMG